MKIQHLMWIPILAPLLTLSGCQQNTNAHPTPANAMPLVKTGVGEIQMKNQKDNKYNPNIYNANTANIDEVKQEDMGIVEFMPADYLPIGGDAIGGTIIIGSKNAIAKNINTGGKNQSQNATYRNSHGKVTETNSAKKSDNQVADTLKANEETAVKGANQDVGDGFKASGKSNTVDNNSDSGPSASGSGYNADQAALNTKSKN